MYTDSHVWATLCFYYNFNCCYYRFQIDVTFAKQSWSFQKHYNLTYSRTSEASVRSESSCIFIPQERTTFTSNFTLHQPIHIILPAIEISLAIAVNAQICSLFLATVSDELFWHKFTLFPFVVVEILTCSARHFSHCHYCFNLKVMFLFYDFNYCFYNSK